MYEDNIIFLKFGRLPTSSKAFLFSIFYSQFNVNFNWEIVVGFKLNKSNKMRKNSNLGSPTNIPYKNLRVEPLLYSEITYFDWLKHVKWLTTSNENALFKSRVITVPTLKFTLHSNFKWLVVQNDQSTNQSAQKQSSINLR